LRNTREPQGSTGKVQALDLAVAASSGEVLLFTDCDCTLPPAWVAAHLRCFDDPAVGVVFGQISMPRSGRFLDAYQAFDQRLIHQYSSGSAGLGVPTGCFGNNLSARRSALADVGGFAGLGYTVTEDAALIAAVGKTGRWRVVASTLGELTIVTRPLATWRAFVNQHTRWNIGGFYSSDAATRAGYRFLVLYLTASMILLPFALLWTPLCVFAIDAFASVGLLAVLDATLYPHRLRGDRLAAVPFTVFFLFFYSLITLRAIARSRPEWKGSRLDVSQRPAAPASPPIAARRERSGPGARAPRKG
jgi:cellulose synthase/poly-beta-1,6-N-acetylglucosamine synthase-like glycosyltransferase